jgi:hypothetical protein
MFFILSFLFVLLQNQRTGGQKGYQWERGGEGKGSMRVKTVQKMCTDVCKCKNDTYQNYSGNQGGGNKGEW